MIKFFLEKKDGQGYLKISNGISYYYGLIDINIFPDELKNNAETIINEAFEYYCKNSDKIPQIISKLELSEDSDKNNFLISFRLNNEFVKINKIINIEVTRYQKTMQDFMKDQFHQITDLENNLVKSENNYKILKEDHQKLVETQQKLIDENKNIKEEILSLRESIAKIIMNEKNQTLPNTNLPPNGFNTNLPPTSFNTNLQPNGFNTNLPNNGFNTNLPNNGFNTNLSTNTLGSESLIKKSDILNPDMNKIVKTDGKFCFGLPIKNTEIN